MKRLPVLFFFATVCFGQQTVIQRVLNAVSGPGASSPVQNVGQGAHQVSLFVTNSSGTCSGSGQLEYSFDNVTWTIFNSSQAATAFSVSAAGTQVFQVSGNSIYPLIRFNLTAFSGGSCTATAWYSSGPGGSEPVKTTGTNTVFITPFNNFTGGFTTLTLASNTGQTIHELWMTLGNIGGQTCASGTDGYTITLNGTGGGSDTTHQIAQLQGSGNSAFRGPSFGSGAYPTLQIVANPFGSGQTHCTLTVWYEGINGGGILSAVTNGPFVQFTPITQCSYTTPIQVTAGNTTAIVPIGNAATGYGFRICQIVMTTPTAAAIATVSFGAAGCTGLVTQGVFNMAVGVPVTLGSGLGNIIAIPPGSGINAVLCVQAQTGNINGYVSYDYQ